MWFITTIETAEWDVRPYFHLLVTKERLVSSLIWFPWQPMRMISLCFNSICRHREALTLMLWYSLFSITPMNKLTNCSKSTWRLTSSLFHPPPHFLSSVKVKWPGVPNPVKHLHSSFNHRTSSFDWCLMNARVSVYKAASNWALLMAFFLVCSTSLQTETSARPFLFLQHFSYNIRYFVQTGPTYSVQSTSACSFKCTQKRSESSGRKCNSCRDVPNSSATLLTMDFT